MGQSVASDCVAEAYVVEFGLGHPQVGLDVPKAPQYVSLAKAMREGALTREALDLVAALVPVCAFSELVRRHEVSWAKIAHSLFMGLLSRKRRECGPRRVGRSNR
jgi:hypothetical protein